jgi:predicted metalloendopeptidase
MFLSVEVWADHKNTNNTILILDEGTLGLDSRSFYMNDSLSGRQMGAYRKLMLDSIRLLTTDMNIKMKPQMEADVDGILDFERQLANITVSIRNLTTLYNKWTIKSLTETVPFIDWLAYFKIILPSKVFDRISDPDFFVVVFEPEYMLNLQSLLKQTDKKVLVNYGIWRLVKSWSTRLDVRFDDIFQDFYKTMYGRVAKPSRSETCVSVANSALNMAVGALYVQEYFNKSDKIEALSMVQNLQKTYKEIIKDLDWMDDATKLLAMEKIDATLIEIGYPDYILDTPALDLYYSALFINDSDSYFNLIKNSTVGN